MATNVVASRPPNSDRLQRRPLVPIANSIVPGIVMEYDTPSRNTDKKMPILDMKVWVDKEGFVLYQHYEKEVTKKAVLHSQSAHPSSCKRSIHTQEVIRRLLNSSNRIDWKTEVAPIITSYMKRMEKAGYKEQYRKSVLQHAIEIYDRK